MREDEHGVDLHNTLRRAMEDMHRTLECKVTQQIEGVYCRYLDLLFDRSTPASHFFPTPPALAAVPEWLNDTDLAAV